MNVTISSLNSNIPRTTWTQQVNKDITTVYVSMVVIVSTMFIQFLLTQDLHIARKHLSTFFSTPTKLITFLYLGQAPLRYSGFLNHFPLTNITGVAAFGGVGLSALYFFQDQFLPISKAKSLSLAGEQDDNHRQDIKLDRALQEKVIFLLVGEIYHTVIGVVIGVLAMRICKFCVVDHKHLDLLMTAGLFGPVIFFALFLSLAGVVFGVSWCLQRFRHGWAMH